MRRVLIAIVLMSSVAPAMAQSDIVVLRVDKLEKEMKAVQRKVFPNGATLEPELGANTTPVAAAGNASGAPITDLTARVDALESQLKSMTGQVEQDGFRLKKVEDALKGYEGRLKALEVPEAVSASSETKEVAAIAPAPKPIVPAPKPTTLAKPAATKPVAAPTTATAKVDPARKAAITAVEVPATGDAAEDAYTYGFRLWGAKLYPEAQTKLKEFMAKYPTHKRASFAQNLLGRAYLDEGKPALASVAFYDNYQKNPRGDRASESLYWLGVSLTRLKKPADACKVYTEFDEVYGAKTSADLKAKVAKGKTDAKCPAA
jgi:TolA-binding protein